MTENKLTIFQRLNPFSKTVILMDYVNTLKEDKRKLEEEVNTLRAKLMEVYEQSVTKPRKSSVNQSDKPLTPKEQMVYDFIISQGKTNASMIMKKFKLSATTVKLYCSRIRVKGFKLP